MAEEFPVYYSSLALFKRLFRQGAPVLTYHKLGPRPVGTRLKGLYLSQRLFRKQLAELQSAKHTSVTLSQLIRKTDQSQNAVTFTFDDGFSNVLRHGLEPLAHHGFHAIQFLVADFIGKTNQWDISTGEIAESLMDAVQVREWLAAGHEIGSHTLSHPYLTQLPKEKAREEITASRKQLEDQFGVLIEHFCYPYGDWNEAVRDLVVAAGYRTACTTDFGVNPPCISPFALKRITARYPSRNLKMWLAYWRAWWKA